jgi:hypothetical protein
LGYVQQTPVIIAVFELIDVSRRDNIEAGMRLSILRPNRAIDRLTNLETD